MEPAPDTGQRQDEAVEHALANASHHYLNDTYQPQTPYLSNSNVDPQIAESYTDAVYRDDRAVGSDLLTDSHATATHGAPHEAVSNHDHHANRSVDPDDFYKSYRTLHDDMAPDVLPIVSSSSSAHPSVTSNGVGMVPKHPQLPGSHTSARANFRSVSNPVDTRLGTGSSSSRTIPGKPSVKDLKKRFDQNSSVPLLPPGPSHNPTQGTVRKARAGTADNSSSRPSRSRGPSASSSSRAAGAAPGSISSASHQSEFVAGNPTSSSSQSFASRVGKPRSHTTTDSARNNSMTNRALGTSPPLPSHPTSTSPISSSGSQKLLFGEIPHDQHDASGLGYGIDAIRPRRTSESSVHSPSALRRSLSSQDVESNVTPPPTTNRDRRQPDPLATLTSRPRRPRSQSDDGASPSARAVRKPMSKSTTPTSKLPINTRTRSSNSTSTSPSSTRPNSPSALRRYQANGRTPKAAPPASRAKTPTQSRKAPPQALITGSNSNTRLRAYVSPPLPKLSPPLRSSRPRQPVSQAATISSGRRETEKARSRRPGEATGRRRKISVGPIDFEQRREHIRLAYTKSIRESEELEARQRTAAAAKREQELANEEYARLIGEPASLVGNEEGQEPLEAFPQMAHGALPIQRDGEAGPMPDDAGVPLSERVVPNVAHTDTQGALPSHESQLTVSTEPDTSLDSMDSPTLGVPGTFPAHSPLMAEDEPPQSAISGTSDTTEFDTEPQTNPPVQAHSPLGIPTTTVNPPSPKRPVTARTRSEYRYPFEDDVESPAAATATLQGPADVPLIPSSFLPDAHGQPSAITESPGGYDESTQTTQFPRLDSKYDSDYPSDLDPSGIPEDQARLDDGAVTDTCTEETDDPDQGDPRHHDYDVDDETPSYRYSTCESSELDTYDEGEESAYEQQQHTISSNFLAPGSGYGVANSSRQSAWTDFSVDSTDRSDPARSPAMQSHGESPPQGHVSAFTSRGGDGEAIAAADGQHSHWAGTRQSVDFTKPSTQFSAHQLPEVDTGEGFSVPYLSPEENVGDPYIPSPNHEPPPIPTSVPGSGFNSRTSSAFYEQSQYDSTLLNSERESDEYMSHVETSRSVDSTSLATTEQYASTQTPADSDTKSFAQEGEELTDKERHRLIQRRNVIKELVDTEAVFVRDMNIVEEIYKGTAEACPRLDDNTIKLIFRNSGEIIEFHTSFLAEIKEAVADVYVPKGSRTMPRDDSAMSAHSFATSGEPSDGKDRLTSLGPVFKKNIEKMKLAHEAFLRASDQAAKRLIQIQQDPTVQVWLTECNEVAKDLTAAWDLDSLLIKPMQRITKYPNLIITLLQHTPQDHPDRGPLSEAKDTLETAIIEINKTKKNFELVGQIVGRKRKESDVKAGFARAFGKRVDKLQTSNNRPAEDAEYAKLNEKFGDDYLRLQVVLRDVEFYTRQVSAYVHEFLQYMSAIELVMRLQPGNYPELESKWVQFNISIRDLQKVALEDHLAQVRKNVIEPFEQVIKAYGNPSLAMKKRQKRRLDYERSEQLKRGGKSPDPKLKELVEQYDALNDTLKKELPKLSALTEKIGNICLANFVAIQTKWYGIWKDKMKAVLVDCPDMPDLQEVVSTFQRDYPYAHEQLANIGILNPATFGRTSLSTSVSMDDTSLKPRSRPSDIESSRSRGQSVNGDVAPTLPAPDFGRRRSGSFTMSTSSSTTGFGNGNGIAPSPHQYYYRDYYAGIQTSQGAGSASPKSPEVASSGRSGGGTGVGSTRPSTGRSYDSAGLPRQSSESSNQYQRDSSTTYNSTYPAQETSHRFSNLFHSAMPMTDGPDESSQRPSRASSRERSQVSDGYNILWLAASLFEFNISTTKHEAGYPYLTYQAGEIFDVIAEKGELWLAKNQDDPADRVGWIWSKHFAKLADS